jgi:hypothetical protein
MTFQKFFTILVCLLLFSALFATALMADEEKAPLPAPPESQKECDQMETTAASSASPISSPMDPANERMVTPDPLTPSTFNNQESPDSGG